MKILFINSHFKKGGSGKIISYLHSRLRENKIDSYVIYGRDKSTNDYNTFKIGNKLSNYIDGFFTRVFGYVGVFNIIPTLLIIRKIRKIQPDIIHLNVLHGYFLNINILFDFLLKYDHPIIWTFHDCHAFTGKCAYPFSCSKFISGCYKCELLRDYPKSLIFDNTSKMWKNKQLLFTKFNDLTIISPSEWMSSMAKKSFFNKYNIFTINNGINTEVFKYRNKKLTRNKIGLNENAKIALSVAFGQDNPRKGVKYVLQAALDLPNVLFIIIGWKKTNNFTKTKYPNVIVKNFITNQEELALYYSSADVFLLPSLAENYATTAIEALCSGTPVVGFNVGGIPEQVHSFLGATVKSGDQNEFTNKIRYYTENNYVDDKLYQTISKYSTSNNSIDNMFKKHLDLYLKVLNK
jgi:glycosyltransferase involved in cell wall biosynthesis